MMKISKKEYCQGELVEPDELNETRLRHLPMAERTFIIDGTKINLNTNISILNTNS